MKMGIQKRAPPSKMASSGHERDLRTISEQIIVFRKYIMAIAITEPQLIVSQVSEGNNKNVREFQNNVKHRDHD